MTKTVLEAAGVAGGKKAESPRAGPESGSGSGSVVDEIRAYNARNGSRAIQKSTSLECDDKIPSPTES